MKKRILSLFLAVITLLSLCAPAFASGESETFREYLIPINGRAAAPVPADQPAAAAATSGTCGANLTWTYTASNGYLDIDGSGAMYSYGNSTPPWANLDVRVIRIHQNVTSIGDFAFTRLENLTSFQVAVGAKLRSIGTMALANSGSGFGSFAVPESVTTLADAALACIPCAAYAVTSGTTAASYFAVSNGVLYNKAMTKLLQYPSLKTSTSFAVPSSVTVIAPYGMIAALYLKSISLPAGLRTISTESFYGCTDLTSITIPSGVTSIGEGAFAACSSLTRITVESDNCTIYNASSSSDSDYGRTLGTPGRTTVYARTGSTAHTYATKYGYAFQSTGTSSSGGTSGGTTIDPNKKNGLVTEGGYTYFYRNGVKQKGLITDAASGKMYYCDSSYHVVKNQIITVNGKSYICLSDGEIGTGWLTNRANGKEYYAGSDGVLYTGYCAIGSKNYYFSVKDWHLMKGGLVTGPGNKQYYVSANDGHAMKNGWARGQKVKNRTGYSYYYFLDSTGVVRVTRQYKTSTAVSSLRTPQPYEYDN